MTHTTQIDPAHYVSEEGHYQPYEYWLSTCGLDDFYARSLELLGDLNGKNILDCGCGPGHTSIMFCRRGATVQAFDVNDSELSKARFLAEANGVDVDFSKQWFEEIDYPDESFDMAFGSCVIHHVEVDKAAQQLGRVLKPGGRAIFIENSNRNPLLMFARSNIVGRFGVPKHGDDEEEHPLRDDEIETIRSNFPGTVTVHHPSLAMFRLLDFYFFHRRSGLLTSAVRGLDSAFGSIKPMRRYSYFQILEFTKSAE